MIVRQPVRHALRPSVDRMQGRTISHIEPVVSLGEQVGLDRYFSIAVSLQQTDDGA